LGLLESARSLQEAIDAKNVGFHGWRLLVKLLRGLETPHVANPFWDNCSKALLVRWLSTTKSQLKTTPPTSFARKQYEEDLATIDREVEELGVSRMLTVASLPVWSEVPTLLENPALSKEEREVVRWFAQPATTTRKEDANPEGLPKSMNKGVGSKTAPKPEGD